MTIAAATQFDHYHSVGAKPTDTNPLTVLTCPTSGYLGFFITWISIADDGGAARTATLTWTDNSATATYTLVHDQAIPANDRIEVKPVPLVLEPGDSLSLTGSAAGVEITVSYVEVSRNPLGFRG